MDAVDPGAGERLLQHPDHRDDARDGALEAQLHAGLAGGREQLVAVLGEQLLVGGDDVPAGAHRLEHVAARRLDPADQLDDQIGVLEDLVEVAARARQHTRDLGPQPGDPLDPVGVLDDQLGERAADRAPAEHADPEDGACGWGGLAPSVDIAAHQVVVGLAAHDQARIAVLAEDHRRARHAVVVVGHRVAVGAGRRASR